ncbi:hypothetical protein KKG41_06175 [Patescibacteria group bacterium]|nr:hypothetical protein [Patescibacteria group bacterium]MBU1891090.1 hypothetical protein [Patescibacteria group bacterium]
MSEVNISVPQHQSKVVIELPGYGKVMNTGPVHVELTEGWTKTFTEVQGGPCEVTVKKVGKPCYGHRWVTIECEDMTISTETRIICKAEVAQVTEG